jgi:hypothetical protein
VALERRIASALSEHAITVVIVSHRDETASASGKRIQLQLQPAARLGAD